MKTILHISVAALACGIAFGAAAMSRAEYAAQRARIQDKYATDKDRCSTRAVPRRELCEVQARVDYDTARFALRAQFRPSARNVEKAQRAQADAHYALERARCGDLRGSARKVCLDEARNTSAAAGQDERVLR